MRIVQQVYDLDIIPVYYIDIYIYYLYVKMQMVRTRDEKKTIMIMTMPNGKQTNEYNNTHV